MQGKKHTPEQIIHKLRQAEVELSQGVTVPQMCQKIGVTEQTLDIAILKEASSGNC